MDYKISFVVPVYNAEEYLCTCVNSLINQTYQNIEIILVDDGSTDDSAKICDDYEKKDRRIKVIHKVNGGLISSWIRGTKESTGDYLCYVDSDDWVDSCMINEMVPYLSGISQEVVSSDYIIERSTGEKQYIYQKLSAGVYTREELETKVIPYLLGQEHRYVCLSRCMKLISRKLIMDNMHLCNPDIKMAEDTTIMLPVLLDCKRLVIMDHKAYYHYRYVEQSMAHQHDADLYRNNNKLINVINNILKEKTEGDIRDIMLFSAKKEYLLLLLLVIKIEVRGNYPKCIRKIKEICAQDEVKDLVAGTDMKLSDLSNKLLYLIMKHPNVMTILFTRMAMKLYYLKNPV